MGRLLPMIDGNFKVPLLIDRTAFQLTDEDVGSYTAKRELSWKLFEIGKFYIPRNMIYQLGLQQQIFAR